MKNYPLKNKYGNSIISFFLIMIIALVTFIFTILSLKAMLDYNHEFSTTYKKTSNGWITALAISIAINSLAILMTAFYFYCTLKQILSKKLDVLLSYLSYGIILVSVIIPFVISTISWHYDWRNTIGDWYKKKYPISFFTSFIMPFYATNIGLFILDLSKIDGKYQFRILTLPLLG